MTTHMLGPAELAARHLARSRTLAGPRTEQAHQRVNNANMHTRGTYDGAELRPFDGRPGAMDAYHLPSLRNGRRVRRGEEL